MMILYFLLILDSAVMATNWKGIAETELSNARMRQAVSHKAKNVIVFLGDGMGPSTVTAARAYLAEQNKESESMTHLEWEKFPYTGISRTADADRIVTDSSSAATAVMCGEKANLYTVGVNDKVKMSKCENIGNNKLRSALMHAADEGKWTGIITTTRITHATPAAAFAHTADRTWEASSPAQYSSLCPDIAKQLILNEDSRRIRVLLGGGESRFLNETVEGVFGFGKRQDGLELIKQWKDDKKEHKKAFVTDRQSLNKLKANDINYLLGLFSSSHMSYEVDRNNTDEPSISEMVKKAIEILSKGPNGFFLFVEGGNIDKAHHANLANLAMSETVALSKAVKEAVHATNDDETLIVVTADHSHPLVITGYPIKTKSISGLHFDPKYEEPIDNIPYTILGYHNGPGFYSHRLDENQNPILKTDDVSFPIVRKNITADDTEEPHYVFDAGIPSDMATHGGEDVSIYASGPSSHLFTGVHHQHFIAHALQYATCTGNYKGDCPSENAAASRHFSFLHIIVLLILCFLCY